MEKLGQAHKVLRVLAAFSPGSKNASIEDVCQLTGFPRSSAYRYLNVLKAAGFLVDDDAGWLQVTPLTLGLVKSNLYPSSLTQVARPIMQKLSQGTRELSLLVKRNGRIGVCVEVCESLMPLRYTFEVGTTFTLHEVGALRRSLLAYTPKKQREEIIADAFGNDPDHVARAVLLEQELEGIRSRGYAESEAEITADLWGISVPVFNGSYADTVLVLLASRHRVNSTERARLRVSVRATARHISESLN